MHLRFDTDTGEQAVRRFAVLDAEPIGVEELSAGFIYSFVGVGTEVIALCLDEVCGEAGRAAGVVEGECGGDCGDGDTEIYGGGYDTAPRGLGVFDGIFEEGVEEEVFQFGIFVECIFYIVEEDRADDAASPPHECDAAVV